MNVKLILLAAALTLPATAAMAGGDAKLGKAVFNKCMACHNIANDKAKVGPSLMGVIGRPVASVAGFKYSDAMIAFGADGKKWDEALLASYLPDPKGLVKGTKMAFPGLKKPEDVANVIAYITNPDAAK